MTVFVQRPPALRGQRGFTLMEVMIVVALIGILTAIAVPAYNEQARRARRADAKADMLQMVQVLERHNAANATYVGYPTAVQASPNTGAPAYNITPSGLTATAFVLTAVPVGDQTKDPCGNMILTQTGAPTFSSGTVSDCWNR